MTGAADAAYPGTLIKRLCHDRDGIVAIEFAMLAPVVLLLFTAIWSLTILHLGAVALEGGVAAAARQAIIGPGNVSGSREDMIRAVITRQVCPTSLGEGSVCYWDDRLVGGSDEEVEPLIVTMRAYVDPRNIGQPEPFADENGNGEYDTGEEFSDPNGNGQWDPDMGMASAGGSGDYVIYDVRMAQAVNHPLLVAVLGGSVVHEARVVIRNEPWDAP